MTRSEPERRRPRLLVVASTYPRWQGDPEPGFVHGLVRALLPAFDIRVICPHAPGASSREILDGARVWRYRYAPAKLETLVNDGGILNNLRKAPWKWLLLPGFVASQLVAVWWTRLRWRPDAIHAHWLLPQGLVAALVPGVGGSGTPLLITSHGSDLLGLRSPAPAKLKRFAAGRATAITVVSDGMLDELERIGIVASKAQVLPMGVDLEDRFTPDPDVERSSDELLFVGRLTETKGLRHLIAAMPDVLASHPSARLTIVGFGPELAERKAQAVALGIAQHVRFAGAVPQSELPGIYRRAATLVAPFEPAPSGAREGLGLVMVEAIGCGCPVVTTLQPATRDVFGNVGPAGLAEERSAPSLAAEIIRVLDNPGDARASTARARVHIVERFGIAGIAARHAELLSRLMVKAGASP